MWTIPVRIYYIQKEVILYFEEICVILLENPLTIFEAYHLDDTMFIY